MREQGASRLVYPPSMNAYAYVDLGALHELEDAVLAFWQREQRELALVSFTFEFEQAEQAANGTRVLVERVRAFVRKTDQVFVLGESCYFLLPGARLEGARIVQERLWQALLWQVHEQELDTGEGPMVMQSSLRTLPDAPQRSGQLVQLALRELRQASRSFQFYQRQLLHPHEALSSPSGPDDLARLAQRMGVPYLSSLPGNLPVQVRNLVSKQLAQELQCYPLGCEDDVLTVAMADPRNEAALSRLQQETGLTIYPVLTSKHELQSVWL
ncbi:hypothetical protein [Ktedonobacter robiniae]|uniref:Type II secretion system protein GspE N-terminal domain-containing protein n=1 Tax=Ktedonobacter robiniae TaxID=2778365 RepID=A0ABQ3UNA3_9CHLR|nr:hypothetical protein [Ktedonobacter robiniae]GHO54157.1 hypothetical protein KSB_26320 [Ktedonobacter robiniae]